MWRALTQAQVRDAIRRERDLSPPVDLGIPGAVAGQVPPHQQNPSNPLLNQLIDRATSKINRRVKNTETFDAIDTDISAQTANGPLSVQLSEATGIYGQVNTLKAVWYVESGSEVSIPLEWTSAERMRAEHRYWMDQAVGTPRFCWMAGWRLQVWPGPDTAGTLYYHAQIGVFAANADSDMVAQLPADYIPCIIDGVHVFLNKIQSNDEIFGARVQVDMLEHEQSIGELCDWINTRNGDYTENVIFEPTTIRRGRSR